MVLFRLVIICLVCDVHKLLSTQSLRHQKLSTTDAQWERQTDRQTGRVSDDSEPGQTVKALNGSSGHNAIVLFVDFIYFRWFFLAFWKHFYNMVSQKVVQMLHEGFWGYVNRIVCLWGSWMKWNGFQPSRTVLCSTSDEECSSSQ